jgi:TonB family protein
MRAFVWGWVGCFGLAAGALGAQTAKDAEKAFRQDVLKQQLYLVGFSAERKVTYAWTGNGIQAEEPALRTLAVVVPDAVSVKRDRIEIKAQRSTLSTDVNGKYALTGGGPVMIEVQLNGSDLATVLPKLRNAIFFTKLGDAVAEIPATYKGMLPGAPSASDPEHQERRRNRPSAESCAAGRVTPPRVLHAADPEFSDEARNKKMSGNVMIVMTVDEQGNVADPWVARAMGYGLDENAAKAVRQYRFRPAMCGETPVKTAIAVEVNFQIF